MLRDLLALFGPRKKVEIAPTKRLCLELSKIEGALVTEKEFPRVQWNVVHDWLKTQVAEEDFPTAYYELALDWMRTLRNRLGGSYEVFQSPHFMLLTARGAGPAR